MKSIRNFLIIVLLSTICLVNFLAALHGYRKSMGQAEQLLDQQLIDAALTISQLENDERQIPANLFGNHRLFQIWKDDDLQQRSNNSSLQAMAPLQTGYHTVNLNGLRWRLFVRNGNTDSEWIVVGQRYDMYSRLIEEMVIESILPIIWVLPVLGLFIWLIVKSGLRPLDRLAQILNLREPGDLQQIRSDHYPRELGTVVTSINNLLERLGAALEREQRFAADAAHELRTPLTALKINLHNLTLELEPGDTRIAELQSSVQRMGHSIEQILDLHRLTPEKLRESAHRFDLKTLAQRVIVDAYPAAQKKHQAIELEGDTIPVRADEFALQTLLRNLLDNASKYTPDNGKILVTLAQRGKAVQIQVEDSGPGIDETERQLAFNRFYRVGGDAHESQVVGCGLGLSIVAHIVNLHHGSVYLAKSATLGGLLVSVEMPVVSAVEKTA